MGGWVWCTRNTTNTLVRGRGVLVSRREGVVILCVPCVGLGELEASLAVCSSFAMPSVLYRASNHPPFVAPATDRHAVHLRLSVRSATPHPNLLHYGGSGVSIALVCASGKHRHYSGNRSNDFTGTASIAVNRHYPTGNIEGPLLYHVG